jgi:23S rRNA pseudouridine2605 synthase
MGEKVRINRYLAASGFGSRRSCEELVRTGRVSVNGKRISDLATLIEPGVDMVTVDGAPAEDDRAPVVLVLNKPVGVLSTVRDSFKRRTVIDLARAQGYRERLFPVGRLDLDTSGILLLTNEGTLAHRLTHPRFKIEKTYRVTVKGEVTDETLARIARGIELDGTTTLPCGARVLRRLQGKTMLEIKLKEGRKRQIRRMLAACGHRVLALHRKALGSLEFRDCAPGSMRPLTGRELARLRSMAGLNERVEEKET